MRKGRIICSGLRPDGWFDLHRRNGMPLFEGVVPAGDLQREDDPWSWHAFPEAPRIGVRRHRRIDIWDEPDTIANNFLIGRGLQNGARCDRSIGVKGNIPTEINL